MIRICIIINTYYLYIAKDQYRKSIKKLIRNIYLGFIYKIFTLLSTNYIFKVIIYPLDFLRIISQCLPEKVDATKLTSKMDWTSEALRHHAWDSDWDWGLAFSGSLCGLGSLGSFVRCFLFVESEYWHFFNSDNNSDGSNICYISLAPSVRLSSWPELSENNGQDVPEWAGIMWRRQSHQAPASILSFPVPAALLQ